MLIEAVVFILQLKVLYIRTELQYNCFNRVLKQVDEHPHWLELLHGIFEIWCDRLL